MLKRKATAISSHKKSIRLAAPGMTCRDCIKRAASINTRQRLIKAIEPRILMSGYSLTDKRLNQRTFFVWSTMDHH